MLLNGADQDGDIQQDLLLLQGRLLQLLYGRDTSAFPCVGRASVGPTMSKSLKVTSSARVFLTPTVPHRVGLARRVVNDPSLHEEHLCGLLPWPLVQDERYPAAGVNRQCKGV